MKKHMRYSAVILVLMLLASCAKETTVDPAPYAGTWSGNVTCMGLGTFPGTVIITVNGGQITSPGTAGQGACAKAAVFTAVAKHDHLEYPTQINTDACGNASTMSGSIYLNNGQLTASETITGPTLNTTCSFTGTK